MLRFIFFACLLNISYSYSSEVSFSDDCALLIPDKYKMRKSEGIVDYSYMGEDLKRKAIIISADSKNAKIDLTKYEVSKKLALSINGFDLLLYAFPKSLPDTFQIKAVRIKKGNKVVEILQLASWEIRSVLQQCMTEGDLNLVVKSIKELYGS